jgi:hypothetical protein
MPQWTLQLIEPPWKRNNPVLLEDSKVYDRAAERGGSDKIQRHSPLSVFTANGRAAGTSGITEEPDTLHSSFKSTDTEGWEQALKDGSRVVSVRDVKTAVPE